MAIEDKSFNFEASLKELEAIVDKMEQETLPLEKALDQFERGSSLVKDCQMALKQAEQKVTSVSQRLQMEVDERDSA